MSVLDWGVELVPTGLIPDTLCAFGPVEWFCDGVGCKVLVAWVFGWAVLAPWAAAGVWLGDLDCVAFPPFDSARRCSVSFHTLPVIHVMA